MSSSPSKLAAQRAFGTKVPSAMANLGEREDTVVLLDRKDFLAKLAKAITQPIAEEFKSGRPYKGRDL